MINRLKRQVNNLPRRTKLQELYYWATQIELTKKGSKEERYARKMKARANKHLYGK